MGINAIRSIRSTDVHLRLQRGFSLSYPLPPRLIQFSIRRIARVLVIYAPPTRTWLTGMWTEVGN